MKTNYILILKQNSILFFSVIILSALLFNSCKDDDNTRSGTPFFGVEGNPTGLTVDVKNSTTSYTVRSNRPWKVVAQSEGSWVRAFPDEGDDDGIFKIIVKENLTFDNRVMNFVFDVDGKEEPVMFRVEQRANIPFLDILNAGNGISVLAEGGEIVVSVKANVDWTYSLDGATWLTEKELSNSQVKFMASANKGAERTVTLKLSSPTFPQLSTNVTIRQSSGSVVLEEDFSWLKYGSAVTYETTGETRFDLWTQDEKNGGWEVTPNPGSAGQQLVYARQGFVKLGKTGFGSDIISPRFKLDGTENVKVTFKAAGYISAGGAVDDTMLKVSILGAGTPSTSQFNIDNIPNSQAQDKDGILNNIWDPSRAYSFTISGATSATQIQFLGGAMNLTGIGQGKNRIFLDDIKVEIIEN